MLLDPPPQCLELRLGHLRPPHFRKPRLNLPVDVPLRHPAALPASSAIPLRVDEHPARRPRQCEGAPPPRRPPALQQVLVHEPAILVRTRDLLGPRTLARHHRPAQTFHRPGHRPKPRHLAPPQGPLPLDLHAHHLRPHDHIHRFRFHDGPRLQVVLHDVGRLPLRRIRPQLDGSHHPRLRMAQKRRPPETCHHR